MRSSLLLVVTVVAAQAACAHVPAPETLSAPPRVAASSASPPTAASVSPPAAPETGPATSGASPAAPAAPPPAAEPASQPSALDKSLEAATGAIAAGDLAAADTKIAAAAAAAGEDAHRLYLVARVRAVRFAYSGDLERAADALVDVIPALARHPELPDEFWAHNAMMMIREAQGDPAAALAENDQATLCAARGSWNPADRATLAFQKDRWHRAYLTRMLAESRTGSARRALVEYARTALDEYRTQGFPDSVAVLESYFAALDGQRAAALAAARRVDPAKDDDVEDLYLVVVGLEAGGDHVSAEAVRRVMRRPGPPRLSRAIMLHWLDLDARAPRERGFTPWHAAPH